MPTMSERTTSFIRLVGATQNNLKSIDLEIPHYQLIVVTGVSGSGKSSLAFEVLAKEGQRRFLETFSSFSRQFMSKLNRPNVQEISSLPPVITLSQKPISGNARSTVGTLSDLYDWLRLLYARLGKSDANVPLSRSLFSFNSPTGACPTCSGLGLEEKISLKKLVEDPVKTLREGALAPTLPNGYIMYSQVTVEVLNIICEAHGFSVDVPWDQLREEDKAVILYGSKKIKVPFGKHSLESRLKWTGITAKPREEGFYKGMIPIMADILRRDRNKNILRYVESVQCSECKGTRLNETARRIKLKDTALHELTAFELSQLRAWLANQSWDKHEAPIAQPIIQKMVSQIEMLENLGIGYLTLHRASNSLSGGESQRIRLVNQLTAELSQVLYIFDEPSIGLHPRDNHQMLGILRKLVNQGNTVIIVEHDEETIRQADWIIDIGPAAGTAGGELLFNGPMDTFLGKKDLQKISPTYRSLIDKQRIKFSGRTLLPDTPGISLKHCSVNNLKQISATFQLGAFNVVTGVAGAGKSSLVHNCLQNVIEAQLSGKQLEIPLLATLSGESTIDKIVTINQKPIGRTPRSNPATYTGLADRIRDLFAKLEASKAAGFSKSRFSFNTKGGRCEECLGAGRLQVGMHFMGNVDISCPVCEGKRFNSETLTILYQGLNISEILELRVNKAISFFEGQSAILKQLHTLRDLGLGYLQLGQPSTTLSGGEAQRIKLASEIQKKDTGNTLYLLDEPSIGLHIQDIHVLVSALRALTDKGNTVVCIEHDAEIIRQADWMIDLGPGSGSAGGEVMYEGIPSGILETNSSLTGKYLANPGTSTLRKAASPQISQEIKLTGVTTHLLQNVSLSIPHNKLTVITGVSGSGKSSLAFDTLYAEAQSRFTESMSTYTRSLLKQSNPAQLESAQGLGPVIAIGRKYLHTSNRSTVGTLSGIYDHFRLFYSRIAQARGLTYSAQNFSFNHQSGACPTCDGLGFKLECNPAQLINHPEKSILAGAIQGNKVRNYFGDPHGQHVAILKIIAAERKWDLSLPWNTLSKEVQHIILYGTGELIWEVNWEFKNKTRTGVQEISVPWLGYCHYINDEYLRKQKNKNVTALEELLHEQHCATCQGTRLQPELLSVSYLGKNIAELSHLSLSSCYAHFSATATKGINPIEQAIFKEISLQIMEILKVLVELGLGHLSIDRKSGSLSGGEGQRLRLARALSAQLFGVTYILDEPTIGLHEKDSIPLLRILKKLIALGNTVIVVEHDETMIKNADHLVELGPGAGKYGGKIISSGTLQDIMDNPDSPTGQYLQNPIQPSPIQLPFKKQAFGIQGGNRHTLKNVQLDFIAGGIIAVTGVSGSGKTTLVRDILFRSAVAGHPVHCESSYGLEQFDRVLFVNQSPIGNHSLSTVATFSGAMDELRTLFAKSVEAKSLGLKKSAFSYLHKDGMCPECKGMGRNKTALDFIGDVWVTCESCKGKRYKNEVLACTLNGLSIADILDKTVAEAIPLFPATSTLFKILNSLTEVGLIHLQLGQSTTTLSGGEAQRLKLAHELIHHRSGANLYLFDEPTTGLHFQDIKKLMELFNQMVREGHTVLVIEHHPLLIGIAHQEVKL